MAGLCIDCPDLPNGTRKRATCCRREGGVIVEDAPAVEPPAKGRRRVVRADPPRRGSITIAAMEAGSGAVLVAASDKARTIIESRLRRRVRHR
jgi:hypothetical protein